MSFVRLKGRCRSCGKKISPDSIIIELVAALIGAFPLVMLPMDQAIATAVFGWLMLPLVWLDHRHLWLPDRLILLLAATGLLVAPMLEPQVSMAERLLALLVGFASLEVIRRAYKAYRQQDGMGAGDPKLFGALGIWLGWQALPVVLLMACAIGFVMVVAAQTTSKNSRAEFPFGSYLGIAAYVTMLV